MPELSPDQIEDIKNRREEFLKRHQENVEELEIDFVVLPTPTPIGPGVYGFGVQLDAFDKKYMPVPSPLNSPLNSDEFATED